MTSWLALVVTTAAAGQLAWNMAIEARIQWTEGEGAYATIYGIAATIIFISSVVVWI